MIAVADIDEWMNKQIEAKKLQHLVLVVEEHDDDIDDKLTNLSANNCIHIGAEAVRYIADRLGTPIYVTSRKNSDIPYELALFYKGEKFIGIESEAEYRERGAVV